MTQRPKKLGLLEGLFCFVALLGTVVLAGAIGGITAPQKPHSHPASNEASSSADLTLAMADLVAQQEMSNWAFGTMIGGIAAALVSLVALYFLYGTLLETRQTLKEAQERNALEMRAYILVEPKGIDTWIGDKEVIGQIEIRNLGKTLAKNVSSRVRIVSGTFDQEVFEAGDYKNLAERTLPPQACMRQSSKNRLKFSEIEAEWPRCVFVYGCVFYTDYLGRRHTTHFCHRYNKSAHSLDFAEVGLPQENLPVISANMARHHIYGNDAE